MNFILSLPLEDLVINRLFTKTTKSNLFLNQLTNERKMTDIHQSKLFLSYFLGQSRSKNYSGVSKMREYDKIMSILDFSSRMQKSEKERSITESLNSPGLNEREAESPDFKIPKRFAKKNDVRIEAFKRQEKIIFKDIRNLLGIFSTK